MRRVRIVHLALLPAVLVAVGCHERAASDAGAAPDSASAHAEQQFARAVADSAQWPDYGRDYTNRRWSTLAQINPGNVANLRLAWVHHSGIPHASETNPIVVDGVMYFSTALNHVFAVDA